MTDKEKYRATVLDLARRMMVDQVALPSLFEVRVWFDAPESDGLLVESLVQQMWHGTHLEYWVPISLWHCPQYGQIDPEFGKDNVHLCIMINREPQHVVPNLHLSDNRLWHYWPDLSNRETTLLPLHLYTRAEDLIQGLDGFVLGTQIGRIALQSLDFLEKMKGKVQ